MGTLKLTDVPSDSLLARSTVSVPIATSTSMTNRPFMVRPITGPLRLVAARVFAQAVTATIAVKLFNSSGEDVISGSALAIDATPEKFKTLSKIVLLSGGQIVEKAATTAITFTAAHVIATGSKWGIILVQAAKADGAISTKVPGATQTTPMSYATSAAALLALPSPDSGKLAIGYILIQSKSDGSWTANTDDLTDASDVTSATFTDGTAYQLTAITSITPVALKTVAGTLTSAARIKNSRYLVGTITTDGTGALTGGVLTMEFRPDELRGDQPLP